MNNDQNKSDKSQVKPVPEGYHTVTPFLMANNASMLLRFMKEAFNGETTYVMNDHDGKVMHATVKIGDSIIMVGDSNEKAPPIQAMFYLYVEDADSMYKQAVNAKAIAVLEPADQFYGDRAGCVRDAWDNVWWIATHKEDLNDEEIKRRMEESQKAEAHP